ncbi:MAG: succinate dehydrogenase assembly factor 2 [Pseudomonadales bacterium]
MGTDGERDDRADDRAGDREAGEDIAFEARLARARWRSRRGLLELELLLIPFAAEALSTLPLPMIRAYEALLEFDDLDVHEWLLSRSAAPDPVRDIVAEIRRFLRLD